MVEAARALFEEKGVQATTVADICERADVAHKTFFNHFPAKQDLLRAMADEAIEVLFDDIERARRGGRNTAARIAAFFEGVAATAGAAGPMRRELLTEIIHAAQKGAGDPDNARRLHAAFGAIVREGIAAEDVTRKHSAETLTESILGAYYALMFNWANLESYPLAARARAAGAFLADALSPREGEGRSTSTRSTTTAETPPRPKAPHKKTAAAIVARETGKEKRRGKT
jgi:AcrR family transcriptional regulator